MLSIFNYIDLSIGLFSFKVLNKKKLAETQGASANGGARRESSSPTELQIDVPGWNHFYVDCVNILVACFFSLSFLFP